MSAPASPRSARAGAVLSLIGHTPTVPLRFEPEGVTVFAKCEFLNPSGSVKDRLGNIERIVTDSGYRLTHQINALRDRGEEGLN